VSRKPNGGSVHSIWQRDKRRCWICGHGVNLNEASRDHIEPRGLGGYDKAKNYRLAHRSCNSSRHRIPAYIVDRIRNELDGASAEVIRAALNAYRSDQDKAAWRAARKVVR
jgi:5-methylcytosine-specific restriction endonuclease McrA